MQAQPIELIHVSDIHFGSGEVHGGINPQTGLNVRLEDFAAALTRCVDYALEKKIDIFLFSGDAYRNASPEPIYQKLFAEQLRRLSEAKIQTVLLVGNHDQIFKATGSHSMSVFQSLGVPNLIIVDRPQLLRLDTARGTIQLIGLPYVTRHLLMTSEQYAAYPQDDIERVLRNHVAAIMNDLYSQLDQSLPAVVTAHLMVDGARAGAEQDLLVGYTNSYPLSIFMDSRVDYVGLGHVHKHQVLNECNPAIVYAGSLERVDFSEEHEDKGFMHVQVRRGDAQFQFLSIEPRTFKTIDIDVTQCAEPMEVLLKAVRKNTVPGCVLRLRYRILEEQMPGLNEQVLNEGAVAAGASMVHLKAELVKAQRDGRMPELTEASAATPIAALETYLDQVAPDRKDRLMTIATELWSKLQETKSKE